MFEIHVLALLISLRSLTLQQKAEYFWKDLQFWTVDKWRFGVYEMNS